MASSNLGRLYEDGEIIVRQGEEGSCMYVIQEGQAEVLLEDGNDRIPLAVMKEGEFFGEMAIFERQVRSATVKALGPARVLTIDKRTFLRRIQEDPSLAFNILETMSRRVRRLSQEIAELSAQLETTGSALDCSQPPPD